MRVVYFSHSDGVYGAPKSLIDFLHKIGASISFFYEVYLKFYVVRPS